MKNSNRLFLQLRAAIKSWTPKAEEIYRDDTTLIGEMKVLGRSTFVWVIKSGGFDTGDSKLAGFHVTHGYSHLVISPCEGDDLSAIFFHELTHCIHWHTCAYEPLSVEGVALLSEHAFRLCREHSQILSALDKIEASLNEEGGQHEC